MGQSKLCGHDVVYQDKAMPEGREVLPLFDKVAIRRDEVPEKQGLIFIPSTARDDRQVLSGKVAATGPEVKYLMPGDYVVFGQYAGSQVKVDGITYVVMKEADVHTVIRDRE